MFLKYLVDFCFIERKSCEVLLQLCMRKDQNEGENLRSAVDDFDGEDESSCNDTVLLHDKELGFYPLNSLRSSWFIVE